MGGEFGGDWIHVYMWLSPLLSTWSYHNIVNWLYSSKHVSSKLKKNKFKKWSGEKENTEGHCTGQITKGHRREIPISDGKRKMWR